jgi:hypothetical protein
LNNPSIILTGTQGYAHDVGKVCVILRKPLIERGGRGRPLVHHTLALEEAPEVVEALRRFGEVAGTVARESSDIAV